ncbi:MAG TPA: hypothetical protein VI279_08975 [Rhodocyclaceae bacterium]
MVSQIGHTLKQVGFANLLWNKVEVLWYLYFTVLMRETERPRVDAIYRSHDTGNKKRALILTVAEQVLKSNVPGLAEVREAIRRTNEAARTRNALMHADFHLVMDGGTVNVAVSRGGDHSKPNSLGGVELDRALSEFIGTLKVLVAEVEHLLPPQPPMPPGVPGMLTSVGWVTLLEQAIASEGGEPLDCPAGMYSPNGSG